MAMRHDAMEPSFLPADPPPPPLADLGYQPRSDLATEYFNTFSQICDTYRPESEANLRQTSDSLRLTTQILDGGHGEFISTDFLNDRAKQARNEFAELCGAKETFQFGQPDASALLRQRARRRYHEEAGHAPPPATSHESGVSLHKATTDLQLSSEHICRFNIILSSVDISVNLFREVSSKMNINRRVRVLYKRCKRA